MTTLWQDVFLTNLVDANDAFVAPVMSVSLHGTNARYSHGASDWLALAFPSDASDAEINNWNTVIPGDMIRVGTPGTGGHTSYVTVMETQDMAALVNRHDESLEIVALDSDETSIATFDVDGQRVTTNGSGLATSGRPTHISPDAQAVIGANGLPVGSLRCVRLNHSIDCSTIDLPNLTTDNTFASARDSQTAITTSTRGEVTAHRSTSSFRERLFFPCYRHAQWYADGGALRMAMPTNIRHVTALKLCGYHLTMKPHMGIHGSHERGHNDWYALRVREVHPTRAVMSNNPYAHGALHVIHAGTNTTQTDGVVDLYKYEPDGISCMECSEVNLPSLTFDVLAQDGQPASFGRMHLWIRVLTKCR
jgi:hypothetical protein